MPAADVQQLGVQFSSDLGQYWGWFLAFGIGLTLLGVAAVARAVTATVASMLFFGWLWCWRRRSKSLKRPRSGIGRVSFSICWLRFCLGSPVSSW